MKRLFAVLLLFAGALSAQVAHPRIWLDSARLARLNALVAAKDPSWVALKAQADKYLTYTVPAYDRTACSSNQICYTYEGTGWQAPVQYLALAYKMTGNTAYSDKVKEILNVMVAAGAAPAEVDLGFPSRTVVLAQALAYDWIYDQLSATDKTNLCALIDSEWAWLQTQTYQWGTGKNAYGNYFGGHVLGYGLAALAIEGDDSNAATMQSVVQAAWTAAVAPAFASGGFQGGYPVESFNYGQSHMIRLMEYANGMLTAGKTDLSVIPYHALMANNLLYNLKPDLWSTTDEGEFSGSYVRIMPMVYPLYLSSVLSGQIEGGWMKYLYQSIVGAPGGTPSTWQTPVFEGFLYNINAVTPVDYTATQPAYLFSPGDSHSYARTSWTTSAVETTFNGGTLHFADHQARGAGHISIQRGGDYLLINSGEWAGSTQYGISGQPQIMNSANWRLNTLYYWDTGTAGTGKCLDQTASGGQYAGCQMFWPTANTVVHKESAAYVYSKADLRPAYLNNLAATTINSYYRSFATISGVSFVFDNLSVTDSSYIRKLFWHLNPQATNSVTGNVVKSSLGTSNLFIATLLPAAAAVALADDDTAFGGTTKFSTRVEIADTAVSTEGNYLTVLAPTDSIVGTMPTTTTIRASGFVGALYDDGTPRVALFSADGTAHPGASYAVSYDSRRDGRHVIMDLTPGVYSVRKDGGLLYRGILVGNDGSLSFVSQGGGAFIVVHASEPSAALLGQGSASGQTVLQ